MNKLFKKKWHYTPELLEIITEDDGIGFDMNTIEKGSGLINMSRRVELIMATLEHTSLPDTGVKLKISYPYPESRRSI